MPKPEGFLRNALLAAGVTAAYFLFARLGMLFIAEPEHIAAFWPASGLQIAMLLIAGRERRPIVISAIFAGNLAANHLANNALTASIGLAFANVAEGLFAVWLIERFASLEIRFTRLRDVRVFILIVVLAGNAATALLGACVVHSAFGADFRGAWKVWWLADGFGMLLFTPFFVEWAAEGKERLSRPDFGRLAEGTLAFTLLLGAFLLYIYTARGTDRIHMSFMLLPFLVWLVVRLETLGMVTANLVFAGLVFHFGIKGIQEGADVRNLVEQTQLFISVTAGSMMVLSAVFSERRQGFRAVRSLNESLERQVVERTAAAEEKARRLAESDRVQRALVAGLTEANAELDAFSCSVSHDLRAPLRALRGFSRALREDCGDRLGEGGISHLDRMRDASLKMESILDGLMAVSRVSRAEMRRSAIDLAAIAREVAGELSERYPERGVEFVSPERMPGDGDPRMVRLIYQNLLDNAWKFTRCRESARVEVGVSGNAAETEYFVRDNGAGFDMEFAGRLFAPFQRLHAEEDFPGTGIGLATVRRAVARHGGRIRGFGTVGQGTIFHFTLPPGEPIPRATEKG